MIDADGRMPILVPVIVVGVAAGIGTIWPQTTAEDWKAAAQCSERLGPSRRLDLVGARLVRCDGQRLRLVTDALGSVRAVVDADTGVVVQRLAYDAYGRVTQDTALGVQPFGYKGSLSDPLATGAGLVWMGVRAYLPAIGRFTTVDSAGLAAGWNQHDALGSDPINMVDADGRFAISVPIPLPGGPFSGPNPGLESMIQDAWDWTTDWAEWGRAGKRLLDLCVDPIQDAIHRAEDAVGGDEDGDAYDEDAGYAESIANGHAWEDHADDFPEADTPDDLVPVVEKVLKNGAEVGTLDSGGTVYTDGVTIVIKQPQAGDGGTVYRPANVEAEIDRLFE